MTAEMFDKLEVARQGDLVYISNNLGTFNTIEKIISITSSRIRTRTYLFNRTDLQCIDNGKSVLFITDVFHNIHRRVRDFLTNKGYMEIIYNEGYSSSNSSSKILLIKNYGNTEIEVTLYKNSPNFSNACYIIVKCNDMIITTGDLFDVGDMEIFYKCTLKRFQK